ncbi:MAG: hypothetical protein PHH82_02665 [Candidatus ainarchaeum sp.]|nr:hypothetical protein [Candidatus ainarchaeum sp.]
MNILLIGCGRTGRTIVGNLLDFKPVQNIFIYSRTTKSSESLAYDFDNKKIKPVNNIKHLDDVDYVIITLSGMSDSARKESMQNSRSTYEVRQDELKFNIGAITQLIADLKKIPEKTPIILVTNPVDEITNYLRIMLGKHCILGFGLELDAKRFEKKLKHKVFCIGSHGKAIPLLNLKTKAEYLVIQKQIDDELLDFIRENGIPHKVAGISFREFFEKLVSDKKEVVHVSHYIKEAFGAKDISISLPFEVKQGKILGIADINPNDIEKSLFVESVTELKKSVDNILEMHKKLVEYK